MLKRLTDSRLSNPAVWLKTSEFNQPESYVTVMAVLPDFCVSPLS